MAGKTISVGCKLPHGLQIDMPNGKTLMLRGVNGAFIIGATYGITENVDEEFFTKWMKDNKDFPPVKTCAIFVAKSDSELKAVADALKDNLTGLEPMRTDGKDPRAGAVVIRNDKD